MAESAELRGLRNIAGPITRLYVDDRRPAPNGWYHATNLHQAISRLNRGFVTELSLDHDLGKEKGTALIDWMRGRQVFPETVHLHTANPYGLERMAQKLRAVGYEGRGRTYSRSGPGTP